MKANAPEKIYFTQTEKGTHYYTEGVPSERNYIEYTRTDTFIEKAAEYLSYHLDTSKIDVNYKFDFIEEFKIAMRL